MSTGSPRRLLWMDLVRGAAVLMVVVHHAMWVALRHFDALPVAARMVDAALTPLRMPTLVFLSGMLLAGSLRKPPRQYFGGKLRHIAYPYAVWTTVYMLLLQRDWYLDGTGGTATLAHSLLTAPSPLWFLLFLLMAYTAAFVMRRLRLPRAPVVIASLAVSSTAHPESRLDNYLYLFAFFLLGDWFSSRPELWDRWLRHRAVLGTCVALSAALVIAAALTSEVGRYDARYAVAVLATIVVLARVARSARDRAWMAPLRYLGRHSLIPYVVHYPVMVAGSAVLVRTLHVDSLATVIAVNLLAGGGAGVAAIALSKRSALVAVLFEVPHRWIARRRTSSRERLP